jgi:hypothetical protein
VQRNDAKQVAARRPEDTAVKPPAELDRPHGDEPGGLGRHVVGLDVDVVAGLVVHRLYRGDQPGNAPGSEVNCASPGSGFAGTPSAADQNAAASDARWLGTSISRVESRLRCIAAP